MLQKRDSIVAQVSQEEHFGDSGGFSWGAE